MPKDEVLTLDSHVASPDHERQAPAHDLRIRPAVRRDLGFVIRLSERVFQVYGPYGLILGLSFLERRVFTLVARVKGKRVGFVMLSQMSKVVELSALAVHPMYENHGVGSALTREAVRWAARQGARWVVLHTAEENIRARNLFESKGFSVEKWIDGYYPNGQKALEMYKALASQVDGRGT